LSEALSILKKYWGHDQFRPLQSDIVEAVLANQDVLALLPTGGGKSICFQVPAMMLDGICLVISPLIALMKDQIENLERKGISAISIHSGMTYPEVKKCLQQAAFGDYKFLYVSPERLETDLFEEFLPAIKPCLIAIDEAHCISQWGYDFRPSYLKIANLRKQLPKVSIIALTASATLDVQNDICEKLKFSKTQKRFQQSFSRPNLSYQVRIPSSKPHHLIELLKKNTECSIVYCKSRKQTQEVARLLQQHQINADYYHAGLSSIERSLKQQNWISNQCTTIVCTNAFGMGIDKPDVRLVIHYAIPESLENYYQEAGRAGRDGNNADAILLYSPHEIQDLEKLNDLRYPDSNQLKKLYTDLMNHLQVPAGIGEGQSFDFDIVDFATNFKWNVLQATYGLQAIAQEGLLYFNEQNFKPSKIVFTTSKEALYDFEHNNPALEPIIKALLRSYEGIFDYPTNIHETRIAKISSTPIELVRLKIQALHKYQVINYQPAAESPQVVLLKNRMYVDAFKFDVENLRIRKEKHAERVNQMIQYTTNESECRSQIIGVYFNDLDIKKCGKCDNCTSDKKTELNDSVFEQLSLKILEIMSHGEYSFQHIFKDIESTNVENVNEVMRYLMSEEIIEMDELGLLKIKKKGPR